MNEKVISFVSEQHKRISRLCKEFSDPENHFGYIRGEIQLLDTFMEDGEKKRILVKQLLADSLQYFNSLDEYKKDVRMLFLWKLLGKYSNELKMEGVLSKLNGLGFFRSSLEFYTMWIEYWAVEKNLNRVNEVITLCINNCQIDNPLEFFKQLIELHFESVTAIPVLNKLAKQKTENNSSSNTNVNIVGVKRSTTSLKPLTRVLEVSDEKSQTLGTSVAQPLNGSNEENKLIKHENLNSSITKIKNETSFTRHMYKDAIDLFAQTLPISEEGHLQFDESNIMKENLLNNKQKNDGDELSIYCDKTINNNNNITLKKNSFLYSTKNNNNFTPKFNFLKEFAEDFTIFVDENPIS